jgi:hypothetical protein
MARRQSGAATLVVVMMLFIIMALLAAYANRGLLFEQRIASTYFRVSLAQEMSDAGVEFSLAMLNGSGVDAACKPVAAGGSRFVDRYFTIAPADRTFKPVAIDFVHAALDCTRTSAGWTCRCPAPDARVAPNRTDGDGLLPSFGIALSAGARPGTLQVLSTGCTDSVVDNCAKPEDNSKNQQSVSRASSIITLVSAVRSPPAAPMIVKGNLTTAGAGLGLHNTDVRTAGLLLIAGGTWASPNNSRMESVPGTQPELAQIIGDTTLTAAGTDFFKNYMGAAFGSYVHHAALRKLVCDGDCAPGLESAYAAGQRMVWVDGPLTISSNKTIGSAADPMVVIAAGDVTLNGPFQLFGLLVSRGNLNWTNTSGLPSLITGALLVEGNADTSGSMDVLYQQSIADQLRNRLGSYVRVPGGWTDAPPS